MGRGDKRTAKGKRFKGTYGVSRPKGKGKAKGKKTVRKIAPPAKKPTGRK